MLVEKHAVRLERMHQLSPPSKARTLFVRLCVDGESLEEVILHDCLQETMSLDNSNFYQVK